MGQGLYHVMLDGRRVGPYDKRTIAGMRQKKALANEHVLIDADGRRLTVAELVRARRDNATDPGRSSARATYMARIAHRGRSGPLPRYDDEVEVRVHPGLLRIAGQRRGRDDRVKIPLQDIVHARARESMAELWFRSGPKRLQAAALRMGSREDAVELVGWLAGATLPPASLTAGAGAFPWPMVVGTTAAVAAILAVVVALTGIR